MAVLTKEQWEKAGRLGYGSYEEYRRAEGQSSSSNFYDEGTGQAPQTNTSTSSSYAASSQRAKPGTVTVEGFGGRYAGGAGGKPTTLYGEAPRLSTASEIKALWSTLRAQKDPRIQSFIDTYAGGNAKVAKAIWDDAATYAEDLAQAGQEVDFFNDVIGSDVFAEEVLSIPKSLLKGTGDGGGPQKYTTEYSDLNARALINDVWNELLGRDAGPKEIASLVKKLNAESKKAPTTVYKGRTVKGFNEQAARAFLEDQARASSGFKTVQAEGFDAWLKKALPNVNLDAIKSDPGFAQVQSLYGANNEAGALRALKGLGVVAGIQEKAAAGELASARETLAGYARKMGVSDIIGQQWLDAAANAVRDGLATEDFYTNEIKTLAKGAYPGLVAAIDAGQDVSTAASPYIYAMSKILEIPSEQLNINDNMIKQALNYRDKDGKIGQKTMWEFEQDLRNDPRWGFTKNAREEIDSVARSVLRDFGLAY